MKDAEAVSNVESVENISDASPDRKQNRLKYDVITGILCAGLLVIWILYLTVSDLHPVGEFLTIWPPVLYLVPAAIALGIMGIRASNLLRIISGALIFLFSMTLIEWRSFFRFSEEQGEFSVVTWNVGGGYRSETDLLDALESYDPDMIFFQESPSRADSFSSDSLKGTFAGYHYYDAGDCAALTRWPCDVLESQRVGPWDEPQILLTEIRNKPVLVVNVRLMLPSLVLNPFNGQSRENLWNDNRVRRDQYEKLINLIDSKAEKHGITHVILAGDFNTDPSARSLDTIRFRFKDAWQSVGSGWGGTVTNQFPVARVDHVYTQNFKPRSAEVIRTPLSDHRPVFVTMDF